MPSPTSSTSAQPAGRRSASVADASDAEDALYHDAHTAHFIDKDPARALRAWEAYLASYPRGRYVLEARYNRALDLVRLGRRDEARAALEPFASGELGGYRKSEARELLDALGP